MSQFLYIVFVLLFAFTGFARESRRLSDWRFKPEEVVNAEKPSLNDRGWLTVAVPHCWGWEEAQRGINYHRGPGWYRRDLGVMRQPGKRYFVRFEAAGSAAKVYLNGQLLGEHRGAFGAFCFEVTTNLSSSGTNLLAVRVSNAPEQDLAPLIGDFPVYGGLYRPVQLIETGEEGFGLTDHASPGVTWLQTSVSSTQAMLEVSTLISNGTKQKSPLDFEVKVLDANGNTIAATNQAVVLAANATSPYRARLIVAAPHLWNGRQDPYLYRAVVELRSTNGLVDSIEQPLGLRFYRVDPDKGFFLNGRPYPIYGVCRHQDRLDKGWAISEADMDEDLALIKEIGATAVRCAHYQHSDYFYSLCDRAGISVWTEIPLVDSVNASPGFEETSRNQLLDLIRQNVNHSSIFAWGLFNEIGNGSTSDPIHELQDLNNLVHTEDPTRPTIAATIKEKYVQMNKIPDLLGWNSYLGWYWGRASSNSISSRLDKERYTSLNGGICIGEYGAGANPRQHEENPKQPQPSGQWHPEEWQAAVHEAYWGPIKSRPFVWGSFVWNMFDFASYFRHEGGSVGLNDKGLVTFDRKIKKDAFYFYKANWSEEPVLYLTGRRFTARTNAVTDVKVYSNLPKVTLLLNGEAIGTHTNDGSSVIVWKNVPLVPGENHMTVKALNQAGQEFTDECVWIFEKSPSGVVTRPDNSTVPVTPQVKTQ